LGNLDRNVVADIDSESQPHWLARGIRVYQVAIRGHPHDRVWVLIREPVDRLNLTLEQHMLIWYVAAGAVPVGVALGGVRSAHQAGKSSRPACEFSATGRGWLTAFGAGGETNRARSDQRKKDTLGGLGRGRQGRRLGLATPPGVGSAMTRSRGFAGLSRWCPERRSRRRQPGLCPAGAGDRPVAAPRPPPAPSPGRARSGRSVTQWRGATQPPVGKHSHETARYHGLLRWAHCPGRATISSW